MYEFFTETMQFDKKDVKICENFSKRQIIGELDKLRSLAYNFEKE